MLSIIIPTYNGETRIPALLIALASQIDPDDEIIVIDDASLDSTAILASKFGAKVHTVSINSGVGYARNIGAQLANNNCLVYFDDDVVPIENYLSIVRQTFLDPGVLCFQGPHHLEPAGYEAGFWGRVEAAIWHHQGMYTMVRGGHCLTLYSGAFCIRRSFLLDTGAFDESFGAAGGEEFEISRRILERTTIKLVPSLQSHHRYKRLSHRLRVLRIRARNYNALAKKQSLLPRQILIPEKMRLLAVAGTIVFCGLGGFWPFFIPLGVSLGVVFICLEAFLIYNLTRWNLWHFVLPVLVFRILTYSVISIGVGEGLLQDVFKR